VAVDHHARVAIGEAGRVGHQERIAPVGVALFLAGAKNGDVVGSALASAAVPGDEQVAVRQLDNPRRVIMLRVQGEDELGGILRRCACNAEERDGCNDCEYPEFNPGSTMLVVFDEIALELLT
jgi:hypothetical protein